MLILIATLACLIVILMGLTFVSAGLHRRYQVKTTTKKRMLSFQIIGRRAVKDTRLILLKQHLSDAITQLIYGIRGASAGVQ